MHDDDIIQKLTNHKNKVKSHDVVALPTQEEQFENMFLRRSVNKHGEEELFCNDMFMRRIHGLISLIDMVITIQNYIQLYIKNSKCLIISSIYIWRERNLKLN